MLRRFYQLVKVAYELRQFETVCELLQAYIANNAVNSNILYSYAGILYHRGCNEKALEECDKLFKLESGSRGSNEAQRPDLFEEDA